MSASASSPTRPSTQIPANPPLATSNESGAAPATPAPPPPPNPRKRRGSHNASPPTTVATSASSANDAAPAAVATASSETTIPPAKKKGRTNTPWTPEEEHLLQQLRGENKGWSEIAKAFPARTEGSVKKHWYKDMHYAEFNEDEAALLREAIREYEANKWKTIGQRVGKPAKACEHYAREHFRSS